MKTMDIKDLKISEKNILVCYTSGPDYQMSREILIDNTLYGYKKDEEFAYVEGYHCSCYDFNDCKFDVTIYSKEEIKKIAKAPYNRGSKFWELARLHI